jgi:hypothetical protein
MMHQWSRPLVRATSLVMSVAILVGVVACGGGPSARRQLDSRRVYRG